MTKDKHAVVPKVLKTDPTVPIFFVSVYDWIALSRDLVSLQNQIEIHTRSFFLDGGTSPKRERRPPASLRNCIFHKNVSREAKKAQTI